MRNSAREACATGDENISPARTPTRSRRLAASPIMGEAKKPGSTSPSMGEVGAKRREGVKQEPTTQSVLNSLPLAFSWQKLSTGGSPSGSACERGGALRSGQRYRPGPRPPADRRPQHADH